MSLKSLQRQWDRFGKHDPLWAVLSLPEKRHGRWDEREFFATGETEIAAVLEHARSLGFALRTERALDFGCGVGRLSQALASHFTRVDGVDIAPSMLERARRYNRRPERCFYHLNERADLALFEDRSFTFIYTSLVLQHVPVALAEGYIVEMLRLLAPGGLLVFHLPSMPHPEGGRGEERKSVARGALPAAAFVARLETDTRELHGAAAAQVALKLRVHNESRHAWPALAGASARHQVTLAGRFRTTDGRLVDAPEARSPVPHDVDAGASAEVFLRIALPPWPGEYRLELDLVQEDVAWFHERSGRTPLLVACRAEGAPASEPPRLRAMPIAPPSFRSRHPRAHRVAQLLRAPMLLRAADAARQASAWHARMLLLRARDLVQRLRDPPMSMNGIPRARVEQLIANAGGLLLEAESSELTFAGWQAYRYWVARR